MKLSKKDMVEGYANSSYNWPTRNWAASDLSKEWEILSILPICIRRTAQQIHGKRENMQTMSFVGDEGREIYLTFRWNTVQVGSGENRHDIRERDILERVAEKFKAHLEAKKNSIEDANCKGKRLIPSSITTNS